MGFDNEPKPYPGEFVIQDVMTLDGAQFKDAEIIVASPPCQAYSYRAMPWKRAKALPPPDNTLFNRCFEIQREASEAAGRHIPLIVENVKGAQKWVGRARWHYGSYYLWGDVPALMPIALKNRPKFIMDDMKNGQRRDVPGVYADGIKVPNNNTPRRWSDREISRLRDATKNDGGSWFAVAHNKASGVNNNPVTQCGWFGKNNDHALRRHSSHSPARQQASAVIAKIPLPLARHIAKVFWPHKDPVKPRSVSRNS